MIRPPHYEKIFQLTIDIVNTDDVELGLIAYNKILKICETHEGTLLDHPFQWETLGDFTLEDNLKALSFYFKALKLANNAGLTEYIASINLAIAEQYLELGDFNKSWKFGVAANEAVKSSVDLSLKQEISETLLEISKYT
ncbi:hypothetical protein RI845_00335 [Thalassotalea nanhaiensis]|uniref:Tetratricopeptide repeat protein n=1 Tax=Thalassotalea nanhaiensis TaxID=3065648 RepID=A0ABY9TIT4_9GAMM|nr:hypothetical protein RI845_00335 [Colwelliaceae bacterium SQ345]